MRIHIKIDHLVQFRFKGIKLNNTDMMVGWIIRWMDGWLAGEVVGWLDGCVDNQVQFKIK